MDLRNRPQKSCSMFRNRPQKSSSMFTSLLYISLFHSYPSSLVYLCTNASKSAARPLPSHTTTGTGGSPVRQSNTVRIVLDPPSNTTQTIGTPHPFVNFIGFSPPEKKVINSMFSQFMYIIELSSCFPFNQNNIARISDQMKHPFLL